MWVKVFKNRPSKICGRQHLKNFKSTSNILNCLPQFLLGPFLNALTHLYITLSLKTEAKNGDK